MKSRLLIAAADSAVERCVISTMAVAMSPISADFAMQVPPIATTRIMHLLRHEFGIQTARLTPLSGYDDINVALDQVQFVDEERAARYGQHFVCKFSNAFEAKNPNALGILTLQASVLSVCL